MSILHNFSVLWYDQMILNLCLYPNTTSWLYIPYLYVPIFSQKICRCLEAKKNGAILF